VEDFPSSRRGPSRASLRVHLLSSVAVFRDEGLFVRNIKPCSSLAGTGIALYTDATVDVMNRARDVVPL